MKTEIVLVRHSEPDKNIIVENKLIPLSKNGKEKIKALSKTEVFFKLTFNDKTLENIEKLTK